MSILGWLSKKSSTSETERILRALSQKDGSADGGSFTSEMAVGVPAVFAAVRVISEDVAKLGARLKTVGGDVGAVAVNEPENRILSSISKPMNEDDDGFTAMETIEYIIASAALSGTGVGYQNILGGITREIEPIRRGSWRKTVGLDGSAVWEIMVKGGTWRVVPRSSLFVLRGPSLGENVSSVVRGSISIANSLDRTMQALARKGGRAQGILAMDPMKGGVEKAQSFVDKFTKLFGPGSDGGLLPVDLGKIEHIRLSLTPQELQIAEARSSVIGDVARAFRVQPARLMHEMGGQTYASAYQWNIAHVNDTIQPWVKRFKQSFHKDVLRERADRFYADFEMKTLLAGAPSERAAFHMAMRQMGVISPFGVAEIEDLPTAGISTDPAFPLLTNPNPEYEAPK